MAVLHPAAIGSPVPSRPDIGLTVLVGAEGFATAAAGHGGRRETMSVRWRGRRPPATDLDVDRIRSHFDFVRAGRVVTNNAASTQPPRELINLYRRLVVWYDNVHRGQSTASRRTTELFETSCDTIAPWLNAPGRRNI